MDFAYWLSCIEEGSARSLESRLVFNWKCIIINLFMVSIKRMLHWMHTSDKLLVFILLFTTCQASWKTSKSHHWIKSYGDFAEEVDFAYWWSCIEEGSARSLKGRLVFNWKCMAIHLFMVSIKRMLHWMHNSDILLVFVSLFTTFHNVHKLSEPKGT